MIATDSELKTTEQELCTIFRIGSFNKYSSNIAPIPPNVIIVSPNLLENDSNDDDDVYGNFDYKEPSIPSIPSIAPSIWDGFYEGDSVIVTFRTRQSFVEYKQEFVEDKKWGTKGNISKQYND